MQYFVVICSCTFHFVYILRQLGICHQVNILQEENVIGQILIFDERKEIISEIQKVQQC